MINRKIFSILMGLLMLLSLSASAATSNTTSFNTSQITQSAGNVKHYVENDYGLPNTVKVGNKSVTESQFLYLITAATNNIGIGKSSSKVTLKNVSGSSTVKESVTSGKLTRSEYISLSKRINSYITTNGKIPSSMSTSIGTMKYQSLVYMYSKVLAYYNTNKVLPSTVSVKSWYATTLGPAATNNKTVQNFFLKNAKTLGSNSYGTVMKLTPVGTGKNKVAIIIGVHPLEVQTHIAMLNAIYAYSKSLKNVQITVFDVIVYNGDNYSTGRTNGQNLANKYVVPNIDTSYKLVMDTHGNTGKGSEVYSGVPNFVFAPLQNTKSKTIANEIVNSKFTNGDLKYHYVSGTSPKYVTIPIANKGIPTIVFEQYINQANYAKVLYEHSLEVLKAINAIFA